jgi:hypothetical protein
MREASFEALVEEALIEIIMTGQVSLFLYAKAEEQGFDINDIVNTAETYIGE